MKLFFFSPDAICSEGSCVTFTTSLRNLTAAVVEIRSFGREHLPSSSTRHLFLHTSTCTGLFFSHYCNNWEQKVCAENSSCCVFSEL